MLQENNVNASLNRFRESLCQLSNDLHVANPTVRIYNATSNVGRFEYTSIFFCFEKMLYPTSTLAL
jgi:hypothetical protein